MKNIRAITLTIIASSLLGCAQPKPKPPTIPALQNTPSTTQQSIRLQAIRDTAYSIGARGGLAWRSDQINAVLNKQSTDLDRIYNFTELVLQGNVLPPVLAEGDTTLNLASPTALRLADRVYQIIQPPRFVTAAPNWRDYLWLNYQAPDKPDSTLTPKNNAEAVVWNDNVKKGWADGINQANQIFSANLGRLNRDYKGMILYRKLLAQNMVTPPYVAKLDLGVTGDANSMRINDQVLRITATSKLNTNAKTWRAIVRPGYPGGEDTDADEASD